MPRFKGETDWLRVVLRVFCECFATANVVMSEYAWVCTTVCVLEV